MKRRRNLNEEGEIRWIPREYLRQKSFETLPHFLEEKIRIRARERERESERKAQLYR